MDWGQEKVSNVYFYYAQQYIFYKVSMLKNQSLALLMLGFPMMNAAFHTANDRYSGNNRYSGIKALTVVACT